MSQQETFDKTFQEFNTKWNGKAEAWVKQYDLFISIKDPTLPYNNEYKMDSKYLNSLFYD